MGCVAEPVGRSEAGHGSSSLATTAAGGGVAKGRLEPLAVVILDPGRHLDAGMSRGEEPRLVQQLVGHPAVKALAKTVLQRLSRRNVVPLHAELLQHTNDLLVGKPRFLHLVRLSVRVGIWSRLEEN